MLQTSAFLAQNLQYKLSYCQLCSRVSSIGIGWDCKQESLSGTFEDLKIYNKIIDFINRPEVEHVLLMIFISAFEETKRERRLIWKLRIWEEFEGEFEGEFESLNKSNFFWIKAYRLATQSGQLPRQFLQKLNENRIFWMGKTRPVRNRRGTILFDDVRSDVLHVARCTAISLSIHINLY